MAVQSGRATGGRADVPLPFFGDAAPFPVGPFMLARASGAPVLPTFCILGHRQTYRIAVEPPIWVEAGGQEVGLRHLVAVMERHLAIYPDQGCNFYDFWGPSDG